MVQADSLDLTRENLSSYTTIDLNGHEGVLVTDSQAYLLTGNGSATLKISHSGWFPELSSHINITAIDLNGYSVELNLSQANLPITANGGDYSIRDTPSNLSGKQLSGAKKVIASVGWDTHEDDLTGFDLSHVDKIDLNKNDIAVTIEQSKLLTSWYHATATIKLQSDVTDASLWEGLNPYVNKLDLNGHSAVLSADLAKKLIIVSNGGHYAIKENLSGEPTFPDATTVIKAAADGTDLSGADLSTASAIDLDGKQGVIVSPTGATMLTGDGSATLKIATSKGNLTGLALDEHISAIDLNGSTNVLVTLNQALILTGSGSAKLILSEDNTDLSNLTLSKLITGIDLNFLDGIVVNANQAALVQGAGSITLKVGANDKDLSGLYLNSFFTIDLNGQQGIIISPYQASMLTGTGNASVKFPNNYYDSRYSTEWDSQITSIDLNGQTVTLTAAQAALPISANGGKYSVRDNAANLSGKNLESAERVTATVYSEPADLSGFDLRNVDEIDLNGKLNVVVSLEQAKLINSKYNASATIKLDADITDSSLTDALLSPLVNSIDLNGHSAVLSAAQAQQLVIIRNGGRYAIKENLSGDPVFAGASSVIKVAADNTDLSGSDLSSVSAIDLNGMNGVKVSPSGATLLTGSGSATLKIAANSVNLSGLTLDSRITAIDLNGKNGVIVSQAQAALLSGSGSATLKLPADHIDLSGQNFSKLVTAIDMNGQLGVTVNQDQIGLLTNTTVSIALKLTENDVDLSARTWTGYVSINLNGKTGTIVSETQAGHLYGSSGATMKLTHDTYKDWWFSVDDNITTIDLNGHSVALKVADANRVTFLTAKGGSYSIFDRASNLANRAAFSDAASITVYVDEDNVDLTGLDMKKVISIKLDGENAIITEAQLALISTDGWHESAKLVLQADTDLSAQKLKSGFGFVTDIDLNGHDLILNVDQAMAKANILTQDGGTYAIRDSVEKLSYIAGTFGNTTSVTAVVSATHTDLTGDDLYGVTELDLNGQAVTLNAKQATQEGLKILASTEGSHYSVKDTIANLSGKTFDTGIPVIAKIKGNNIDLTTGVDLSQATQIDVTGTFGTIVTLEQAQQGKLLGSIYDKAFLKVGADNTDLSQQSLDEQVIIDLNDKTGTVVSLEQAQANKLTGYGYATLKGMGGTDLSNQQLDFQVNIDLAGTSGTIVNADQAGYGHLLGAATDTATLKVLENNTDLWNISLDEQVDNIDLNGKTGTIVKLEQTALLSGNEERSATIKLSGWELMDFNSTAQLRHIAKLDFTRLEVTFASGTNGKVNDGSDATAIDAAGEWLFDQTSGSFTYWYDANGSQEGEVGATKTIILTGVATVTADGSGVLTLA